MIYNTATYTGFGSQPFAYSFWIFASGQIDNGLF